LQQSEWDYILYVDRSQKDEQLQTRSVLWKPQKFEPESRLKIKICVLFHADSSWPIEVRKMKFAIKKDPEHMYEFHFSRYFVWWRF
jgi:hypothetical protein